MGGILKHPCEHKLIFSSDAAPIAVKSLSRRDLRRQMQQEEQLFKIYMFNFSCTHGNALESNNFFEVPNILLKMIKICSF